MSALKILAILIVGSLCLETEGSVPVNLLEAKQGLYWQLNDDEDGFVRVLIYNHGFEHIHSSLVFEWIKSPSGRNEECTVIKRLTIKKLASLWSMGNIKMYKDNQGRDFVTIEGTNTYQPNIKKSFKIQILSIGNVKLVEQKIR